MTRADIEREYTVRNGIIVSPGKFEGEPIWAPYFWDLVMNGMADDSILNEDGCVDMINIDGLDIDQFPELSKVKRVYIYIDDCGFVNTTTDP